MITMLLGNRARMLPYFTKIFHANHPLTGEGVRTVIEKRHLDPALNLLIKGALLPKIHVQKIERLELSMADKS